MKNKKQKGKESIIGKIIYGFLLFMPLLAIAVTCGYAIFNKNAYQSYETNYVESLNKVISTNDYQKGYNYQVKYENRNQQSSSGRIKIQDTNINWLSLGFEERNYIGFEIFGNGILRGFYDDNNFVQKSGIWGNPNKLIEFTFTFDSFITEPNSLPNANANYFYTIYATNKLNNTFYYAIDKVENSTLFNWSKNNDIYNVIQRTCNTLSITNTFIPMLMTYWLLISIIYFLYDIGLMIVIIVHRKIHELQDSI